MEYLLILALQNRKLQDKMVASVQINFILYGYPRVPGIHWCQQVIKATEIQIGLVIYNSETVVPSREK